MNQGKAFVGRLTKCSESKAVRGMRQANVGRSVYAMSARHAYAICTSANIAAPAYDCRAAARID